MQENEGETQSGNPKSASLEGAKIWCRTLRLADRPMI